MVLKICRIDKALRREMKSYSAKVMLFLAAILTIALQSPAKVKEFNKWPTGKSPQEIGKRVAEHFVTTPHTNFNRPGPPAHITYPEDVAWYGALTFARLSGDSDLTARLVKRFDPLFADEAGMVPKPVNVDSTIFGAVPLEIY